MKNYKFTINGTVYEVEILKIENRLANIEVNGTPYSVEINKEVKNVKTPTILRPKLREEIKEIEKKPGGKGKPIRTPLPGIILKLNVAQGDAVKKGQVLFVLEAMKMENEIKAEADGTVSSVIVTVGQSVLQEDVIIEMI